MNRVFCVLLAAGSSARICQAARSSRSPKKQFLLLENRPVLLYSLYVLLRFSLCEAVYLVYDAADKAQLEDSLGDLSEAEKRKLEFVVGGKTRSESVQNALGALLSVASDYDFVLIHDAARPFLQMGDLFRLVQELYSLPCVTLGCPLTDTVKLVDADSYVFMSRLDRGAVQRVQTPQGFCYGLIRQAYAEYYTGACAFSDDMYFLELLNCRGKVLPASPLNIKITLPSDLVLAQIIAERLSPFELL